MQKNGIISLLVAMFVVCWWLCKQFGSRLGPTEREKKWKKSADDNKSIK